MDCFLEGGERVKVELLGSKNAFSVSQVVNDLKDGEWESVQVKFACPDSARADTILLQAESPFRIDDLLLFE